MDIKELQEKLSEEISNAQMVWGEKLADTDPGHYGANDWEAQVLSKDVWVDIPNRVFSFKNAHFSFELRIGGSSDESGSDMSFSKTAKGNGKFDFMDNGGIEINDLEIEVDLDLFSED